MPVAGVCLKGFAGDGMPRSASWTVNADSFFSVEEFVALPEENGGQEVEHPLLRASALEPEASDLEKGEFDIRVQPPDRRLVERTKPLHVAVRLGGYHHQIFLIMAEKARKPLLALLIILFDSPEKIRGMEFDNTAAGWPAIVNDIGIKHSACDRTNVLMEDIRDNSARRIVPRHEDVDPGIREMNGPCTGFLPWPTRTMECQGSKSVTDESVAAGRNLQTAVHPVQIPCGIKFGERSADNQCIATPGKICADFNIVIHGDQAS